MFAELSGRRIHYEKCGSGRALLLVHGNGEDLTIFRESAALLQKSFTVYALDLAGHGKSYLPQELHYTAHAEDMFDFITALHLEKPIFYGFSDGGIIGLLLAVSHPQLLSALIVSGANLCPKGLRLSARLEMRLHYALHPQPRVKLMLTEPQLPPQELSKITVPTFVTAGQFDLIRADHTRLIHAHIPNSTLKIFKGHFHGSYVVHSVRIAEYILEVGKALQLI